VQIEVIKNLIIKIKFQILYIVFYCFIREIIHHITWNIISSFYFVEFENFPFF